MPPRRLVRGAERLADLVGRRLLVGITYVDTAGETLSRQQFCGRVLDVGDGVVVVERPGDGEPAVLPADADAYEVAKPGSYTLSGSGEVVVDPDFVTTWRVVAT
ncbi:hypothetical protein ACIB24_15645 [Spongisporangium articulatum]|uniref:Uncharacterized protein n=1 Tax=Spongisporangium articulatum TaxID=3362603 RepID=A0ABW8ARB5_9ACTN